MSDKTIDVRLKQRYDTEANWNSANPVLLEGEMAISSDKNGKYKVGNGTSTWKQLSYAKSDLQKSDVVNALGYTPPTTDTKYTHPTYTSRSNGLYKVTVDGTGHVSYATAVTKSDITGLGIPSQDTTYSIGNATTAGITKLYTSTGSSTDGTMTQYAITDALSDKAAASHTHNYAGSANPGGSAYNAERLSVGTVGSSDQPVYFSNGKPNACQSYESLKNEILLACYPVGAIYMSTSSTNPGSLFGGTWTAWGSGKVPVGINSNDGDFNTVEKTGGTKAVTLTTSQMPSHSHTVNSHNHSIPKLSGTANSAGAHSHTLTTKYKSDAPLTGNYSRVAADGTNKTTAAVTCGSAGAHTHSITTNTATSGNSSPGTNSQGGGEAHSNLQPYIVCYMWKRTA